MGKSRESKGNYVNRLPPQDFESFYLHFSEGESNQKEFTPAEPVPPPLSFSLPTTKKWNALGILFGQRT